MSGAVSTFTYVAAAAGSVSAIAGAVSARTNLSAVRRAYLPFVYGEAVYGTTSVGSLSPEQLAEAKYANVVVRLINDGPGTAVDVRVCLRSTAGDWTSAERPDAVRALRPGDSVDGFRFRPPWEENPNVESWGVATRFRDTSGRQWESFNQRYPSGDLTRRRLRSKTDW